MPHRVTNLPPHVCLNCGRRINAARSIEGHTPSPGDTTICIDCGYLMVFTNDLTVREVNDEEAYLFSDPDIVKMQNTIGELRRWRSKDAK